MANEKKIEGCKTITTKHGHTIEVCPTEKEVTVKEK